MSLATEWSQIEEVPKLLIVGDGDFGYSFSLVNSGLNGSMKITATSYQKKDEVVKKFKNAPHHIETLLRGRVEVLYEVDARTMKDHPMLSGKCFDQITFNFPHAGFLGAETDPKVIEAHKDLLRSFFKNAEALLSAHSEVHVTHQTRDPYDKWQLPEWASGAGLEKFKTSDFHIWDYPGYQNKRGAWRKANKSFKLGNCSTFKFKKRN